MSDEQDSKNRTEQMRGILDRMTGHVDVFGGSHYQLGRGPWYIEQKEPARVTRAVPTSPGCALAMMVPGLLFFVCWIGQVACVAVHNAVVQHCVQSVANLRPVAVGMRESDLDRAFVYHPFSTYAAYAPDYEHYMNVVTNGNGWNSRYNISNRERLEQGSFIQLVRSHGENSPEFVGLTAAAWKLCLEGRCSYSRSGLGLRFLHWLAVEKQVPEAQFDLTVRASGWETGRTLLTNREILELSQLWRATAARYPGNLLIGDMAKRIDPQRHGWTGAEYMRMLRFQNWLVHNDDVEPVTRR